EFSMGWGFPAELICKGCDKTFTTTIRKAKAGQLCCSVTCSNIYRNLNRNDSETNIERIVREWLEKHRKPFQAQTKIPGVGIVDFLVGASVLECDGIYWH